MGLLLPIHPIVSVYSLQMSYHINRINGRISPKPQILLAFSSSQTTASTGSTDGYTSLSSTNTSINLTTSGSSPLPSPHMRSTPSMDTPNPFLTTSSCFSSQCTDIFTSDSSLLSTFGPSLYVSICEEIELPNCHRGKVI